MASADLRDELICSICTDIYSDPVTLPCGHNYCHGCIGDVLGTQEGSGVYSCPECRAEFQDCPALQRNRKLGNIAQRFLSTQPDNDGIHCTYCIHTTVPATRSCLYCEASLCHTHVRGHSKSAEHVLTEPTTPLSNRKCSIHHKILEYYCCEDGTCVCTSCGLVGDHRGHKVEPMDEASGKKKEKLRQDLGKLTPERDETERRIQRLQETRREVKGKAAGETERITALFRDIREQLEALEKRVLSEISKQEVVVSLTLTELIQQLEIKKDELSRKIHHIEGLCSMADPLSVLQEQESDGDPESGDEDTERDDIKVSAIGNLDMDLISETLLTGLAGIVTGVKGSIYGQEVPDLLLDINTAGNYLYVSGNRKFLSLSHKNLNRPQTPVRFQPPQVLSTRRFHSGQHYWDVEGSESENWAVGVSYPSIGRRGGQSYIGNNNKSWCLFRQGENLYSVRHNYRETDLPHVPSCNRIRISLDYEAGRLSFYELSDPIRHLHTFTAPFTEPLHAAFWVGGLGKIWVTIIN
ncbi:hypothetical protein GDO86_018814 [Hymenochirus boettgeri]|uniref:Uncharacterized protein n=1 Tax=Hymenochirus boettgeri TaxID=247094 RepID=A0A8T2IE22_9PIPI|nr:hypothetical protein GDO86_018814 [Hymenochirus boettgeri]